MPKPAMTRPALLLLLVSTPLPAGDLSYRLGQASLVAAHSIDVSTSWGKPESNPLLRSPGPNHLFGPRGLAVKSGLAASLLLIAHLTRRRHPALSTALLWSSTAATTATALRNSRIPHPARPPGTPDLPVSPRLAGLPASRTASGYPSAPRPVLARLRTIFCTAVPSWVMYTLTRGYHPPPHTCGYRHPHLLVSGTRKRVIPLGIIRSWGVD